MQVSQTGIDLIKQFEGFRSTAYLCPAGILTIGYGSTGERVKPGMVITEKDAELWLRSDLRSIEQTVNSLFTVSLSQSMFDALVSFAYNVGEGALAKSTLFKILESGKYPEAANEFLRWNKGGNKILPGLVKRREAERALFLSEYKTNLATRIYDRMKALNCRFRAINIVYLEDADEWGNPLPESWNSFNDRSILLKIDNGQPSIIYNALATTEPGTWYTKNPMNPMGAFQIQLDTQFLECWTFGMHGGTGRTRHPALVQFANVSGYRDRDRNSIRTGDKTDTGLFGINQHGIFGYNQPVSNIGTASAGCLVRWNYADHVEWMKILRHNHPKDYLFDTIVLDTTKL